MSAEKGNGSRDSAVVQRMRERGYVPSTEAAGRVGVHKSTLYRWIRDRRVEAVDFNGAYFIRWNSVVEHLGEAGKVLGLTKEPEANAAESSTASAASTAE
jgi:excisionase family DNA binding protein